MRACFIQILVMNTVVRDACIDGDLYSAEKLLKQEIHVNRDSYNSYANLSFVRARKLEWDDALEDATEVRCTDVVHYVSANFDLTLVHQDSTFVDGLYI
jgi:hypothetical protein